MDVEIIRPGEPVIDDATPLAHPLLSGGVCGTVPRDYTAQPLRMAALQMPLVPRVEWPERIKEMAAKKSRLSDIWLDSGAAHLDQARSNFCWAHGPMHCLMAVRLRLGLPHVPLSAYAVAATIMNGRNEGGWGGLAQEFLAERGAPTQALWPQGVFDPRRGTAEVWADAATRKITEQWADLAAPHWNRDMTLDQQFTSLFALNPYAGDYNWWGHDVAVFDPVEVEPSRDLMDPARWGTRILNSWSAWGDRGFGVLSGQRANADNATAIRSVRLTFA